MAIYHVGDTALHELARTTFTAQGMLERDDLQRLLRAQIEIVAPDVLVIAEEFGDFDGANRRIDLLGIDHDGHVVVIELKRTDDGGHMELQALRYAAMVSAMTFDQVVEQRARLAAATGLDEDDSLGAVTDWLDGEAALADDVRIVLVASDFNVEITTTVLWLTARHDLDIRCVRLVPYLLDERVLLDVQQVIPLPEARDYQVGLRRKEEQTRKATGNGTRDFTRYHLLIDGADSGALAKQQAVKQAAIALVGRGVPLDKVRAVTLGHRWRHVEASTADAVVDAYTAKYGPVKAFWADTPFPDPETPGRWWIMLRVGGTDTEHVLQALQELAPEHLDWHSAATAG